MNEFGLNKRMLKSIMVANGDANKDIAEYLHITPASVSLKLNGHSPFSLKEISALVLRYDLSPEQTFAIFFEVMVTSLDTY